jgi:dipeptidyl-peptidase 4
MRFACLAFCLLSQSVFAQGTKEDYDRANSFRERFNNKILNERLNPNWIGQGNQFWYLKQLGPKQYEFILVDAVKKTKKPAFDHELLAKALTVKFQRPFNAKQLPFQSFQFSPNLQTVFFEYEGKFQVDLKTYIISATVQASGSGTGLKAYAPEEILESDGGGEQTSINFINQSAEKLKIWWIEDSGSQREYKVLDPNDSWSIATWETHYWLVTRLDGTKLAVYKPDRNAGTAYLDGKKVPYTPPRRRSLNTSPDGKFRIQFENNQAILVEVGADKKTVLTSDGEVKNRYQGPISWAPDSKSAVFFQTQPEEQHPLNIVITTPKDQFQPKLTTRQYLKPGDKIDTPVPCAFRLQDKAVFKVPANQFPNPWEIRPVTWLNNHRFAMHYNQRGHQVIQLAEIDTLNFGAKTLIDERSDTFLDWTAKSFYQVLQSGKEAVWQSERSGWSHLYLFDLEKGTLKNPVTKGDWVVRGVDKVDESKREILIRTSGMDADQDPYNVHYCRVGFDGKLTRLTQGNGKHNIVFSPNEEFIIDSYSRIDQAPIHELRSAKDGKLILSLETADDTPLMKAGFIRPEPFVAKGRDGKTDIYGNVYFPTNYDPNKKYPVIENIYAGPHSAHVPKSYITNSSAQQMAELGFIVVAIDGMGTSQRSKAFHDVCWKNIADAGFPDRILWIKAAAQKWSSMDISKVGIFGTSAGGQNALHAVELFGDFYKVAVADCGCYDNRMDKIWWNEQWMGWPIGPHYEAQSCRTLAPKLQGKLLLLLGEEDTNVDPASTYHVVDALIRAGKEFDFVAIPNVGHGAAGHPFGRRKMQDFFVRHLLGVEPRR